MHLKKGGRSIMTHNEIEKIKDKIHRDGSLTDEKKAELLDLLATMNPETVKHFDVQIEHTERTTGHSKKSTA